MSTIIGLVSTFRLPLQRHIGSPKEKPTRGELDARVVRGTEEVQKGSRSEVNWTLELREGKKKSKREVNACRIGL